MRIYGKNPVLERLKSNPKSLRKIYVQQGHTEISYIRKKAQKWGIPVYAAQKSKIQKMARSVNTQGILAEIDDFEYTGFADLIQWSLKKKYSLLFLDGLNDPQNLGAIIRALACIGNFSLCLPTHKSVGVTEAVLRVACGGDNYVKIAQVSNLGQAISSARDAGFGIVGTAVQEGAELSSVEFPFPLGIIVGSEQKGVRPILKKYMDIELSIPMAQQRMSLNVAQAATLLCYEAIRQQSARKKKDA